MKQYFGGFALLALLTLSVAAGCAHHRAGGLSCADGCCGGDTCCADGCGEDGCCESGCRTAMAAEEPKKFPAAEFNNATPIAPVPAIPASASSLPAGSGTR